jgi:hypothetical protein
VLEGRDSDFNPRTEKIYITLTYINPILARQKHLKVALSRLDSTRESINRT